MKCAVFGCFVLLLLQVNPSQQILPGVPVVTQLSQAGVNALLGNGILSSILGNLGTFTLGPVELFLHLPLVNLQGPLVNLSVVVDVGANATIQLKPPDAFVFAAVGIGINITGSVNLFPLGTTVVSIVFTGVEINASIALVIDPTTGDLSLNVTACLTLIAKTDVQIKGVAPGLGAVTQAISTAAAHSLKELLCLNVHLAVGKDLILCSGLSGTSQIDNNPIVGWSLPLLNIQPNSLQLLFLSIPLGSGPVGPNLCNNSGDLGAAVGGIVNSVVDLAQSVVGGVSDLVSGLTGPGGPLSGLLGGGGGLLGGVGRRKRQLTSLPQLPDIGQVVQDVTQLLKDLLKFVVKLVALLLKIIAGLLSGKGLSALCPGAPATNSLQIAFNFTIDQDGIQFSADGKSATINATGTITVSQPQPDGTFSPILVLNGGFGFDLSSGTSGSIAVVGLTNIVPTTFNQGSSSGSSSGAPDLTSCIDQLVKFVLDEGVKPIVTDLLNTVKTVLPLAGNLLDPVQKLVNGLDVVVSDVLSGLKL